MFYTRWLLLATMLGASVMSSCTDSVTPPKATYSAGSPAPTLGSSSVSAAWPSSGGDIQASHYQPAETKLDATSVNRLKPKWILDTEGDVSATPTVLDGALYVPDWAGNLYAIDANRGSVIWSRKITDYTDEPSSLARVSPAIFGDYIILGNNVGACVGGHAVCIGSTLQHGAQVFAVNRFTGELAWRTSVDSHAAAAITGNPLVHDGHVVVGVSSNESALAAQGPFYPCCTFRGSVVSLDARTGALEWKTYTVPDNHGEACVWGGPPTGCQYSGGAVWGSPSIDALRNTVYVGTGNNYTVPDSVYRCAATAITTNTTNQECSEPDNHVDSVLALDLATGKLRWAFRGLGYDAFVGVCTALPDSWWCSNPLGHDYDFGSNPNQLTVNINGRQQALVGHGQKAGVYWSLDADTGALVWATRVGPGSFFGGIEWGSAFDGERIYTQIGNVDRQNYTLVPSGTVVSGGSWAALDPASGRILWQTADPSDASANFPLASPVVAGGVMFAGSLSGPGTNIYALSVLDGKVLWSYAAGGSVNSSPAIVDGTIYWGTGYASASFVGATANSKLFAFSLDGR